MKGSDQANEFLATYLHDHLAGATLLLDLLQTLASREEDPSLQDFLANLLAEVTTDRETLQTLAGDLGTGTSLFKQAAAWAGEKASRLKLPQAGSEWFQTFEALEIIQLGIHGKLQLWRALQAAAVATSPPEDIDYSQLIVRAEAQYQAVDKRRLLLASTVLHPNKARS